MQFKTTTSPHAATNTDVSRVMRQVLIALIPGTLIYAMLFGVGVLVNLLVAALTAYACEALVLQLRSRPVLATLKDNSALLTACLLAVALPPLAPWWLVVVGTAFAILFAKQLYGGLGFNPFNPAMVGYVVLLISFPREMTQWLPPTHLAEQGLGVFDTLTVAFGAALPEGMTWDAITMATPLDHAKTQLGLNAMLTEVRQDPRFGLLGGSGWEWINLAWLAGGLYLIWKRIITWHIPVAMLASLFVISLAFYIGDADTYLPPWTQVMSGGAMLGAFFIATDPVSAAASPRGKLIFAAGIGAIVFVIRTWGGYPDGVAFAVLLMNIAAPTIDHFYRPPAFGQKRA
jgi:electron transport complex protein RnfD